MKPSPSCPVCGAKITTLLYRKTHSIEQRSFMPSAKDFGIYFDLFRCNGCQSVFAADYLQGGTIAEEYAASDHSGYMAEEANRRRNFSRLITHLLQHRNENQKSLLDIGCSTGLFLDTFRREAPDWKLCGLEASGSAASLAREQFNLNIIEGMLESNAASIGTYSVVTMLDFIEHVREPSNVLNVVNGILEPGGLLLLTTPNIQSWSARIFRTRWWSFRLMHSVYFSRISMEQMLARAGFRIIEMRGLIRFFSIEYCLQQLGWVFRKPALGLPFPLALGDMMVLARKETAPASKAN